MVPALRRILALPKQEGFSRTIVIATDGYVSVEATAFDLIRHNLGKANLFPFGIGSSVNRFLIEGMARAGMGEPHVVLNPQEAPEKAKKFRELIQSPALTGIRVDFEGFEAYDAEPPSIPDLMADRPIILFGKYRGRPQGNIHIRGRHGDELFQTVVRVGEAAQMEQHSALPYLWARHRIALLSDFNRLSPRDERTMEVTNLGLTYNLLTAYTSFVAVDTQVRLVNGRAVAIKQPLPLPQGVSDLAVGKGGMMMKTAAPASEALARRADKEGRCLQAGEESRPLALKSLEVPGGVNEKGVRVEVRNTLRSLNQACRSHLRQVPSGKEIRLVLEVGVDGRVKKVTVEGKPEWSGDFERCVNAKLAGLLFPSLANASAGKVVLTLVVT